MLISRHLQTYREAILTLPGGRSWTREELLTDEFRMARQGELETYYAPHNEYLNPEAQIAIVGITPGLAQMRISIREARLALLEGSTDEEACRRAKEEASFAGSMRSDLTAMLDELGLPGLLGIRSSRELFGEHRPLLHSTSVLRYPAFRKRQNYTGSSPSLLTTPFLLDRAVTDMKQEFGLLQRSLIVPLGKTVEKVLRLLEREGTLDGRLCLWGFPHPSGANGHRYRQFASAREAMERQLAEAVRLFKK
ncbi:hypothetical protein [Cohnella zeiphila]|uniref:Uracil-DNA glycosylase-like domain-containing protein n=1 Tax=Cohnella zeiphila TaxID=2761120 RepID=A0A7X0SQF6_9BACL|nr:hypothetical protein [Cohnella zeiphila]MBB6733199.1 hypothetical protein [Cohnella zeiphila]